MISAIGCGVTKGGAVLCGSNAPATGVVIGNLVLVAFLAVAAIVIFGFCLWVYSKLKGGE